MSTLLQLKGRLNDTVHGQKNVDDWVSEMEALINEAYIHVVAQLRCYQKSSGALALTANDGDYSIVTDLGVTDFSTLRVLQYTASSGSTTLNTLAPTTPDEIVAQRQINPSATSPAVTYAIAGWDTLMLQPLPATGDTITIIYGAVPAQMTLDADTPSRLPQEWHHLISTRSAAMAMEFFDDQRALTLHQAFDAELKKARLWFAQHTSSRGYAPSVDSNHDARIWPGQYFSTIS